MTILKASASELPPNAPLPGTDLGDLFKSRIQDPINYVSDEGGGSFLASLAAPGVGFRRSFDGMNTWGSVFGPESTNKSWGVFFISSLASGGSPIGRLWVQRRNGVAESTVHFSDDGGQSFSTESLATSHVHDPADRWVQTLDGLDSIINVGVRETGNTISVWIGFFDFVSVQSGANWRICGIDENFSTGFLLVATYNTSSDLLIGRQSTDGGFSWSDQGSALSISAPVDFSGRQDYHVNDNEYGVALVTTTGLEFFTVDDSASSSFVQRFVLADTAITTVKHVSALPGRTQGWAIVADTATTTRLYLSNPAGYATFDLALEAKKSTVGSLSNPVEIL